VAGIVCGVSGKVLEYVNVSRFLVVYVTATSEFHYSGNTITSGEHFSSEILHETVECHCQVVGTLALYSEFPWFRYLPGDLLL
jgi:hypothetical protein